eukprot:scpid42418/ scgid2132/ 
MTQENMALSTVIASILVSPLLLLITSSMAGASINLSTEVFADIVYTSWSPCSVCCTQYRDVLTDDGMPAILPVGALRPEGRQYRPCTGQACPPDCELSLWSSWTPCTFTQPWKNRTRLFVHPSDARQPDCGAKKTIELQLCAEEDLARFECSVKGGWTEWQGECNCDSTTFQYQRRTRECLVSTPDPEDVQIRPCISANTPARPLPTDCNRPALYNCFPHNAPPWSAWSCDATCESTPTAAEAMGTASRRRAIGLMQADRSAARGDLAVCICQQRLQTAVCRIPCNGTAIATRTVVAPPITTTIPPDTDGEPDDDQAGDRDSSSTTSRLFIGASVILAILLFAACAAVSHFYKRHKRSREELTSLLDISQPGRASTDAMNSPQVSGQPLDTAENATAQDESRLTTSIHGGGDRDGKMVAEVYINPHYRSPIRYPSYRDQYSDSSATDRLSQISDFRNATDKTSYDGRPQFMPSTAHPTSIASQTDQRPQHFHSEDTDRHERLEMTMMSPGKPRRRRFISRYMDSRAQGRSATAISPRAIAQSCSCHIGRDAAAAGAVAMHAPSCYSMTSSTDEPTQRYVTSRRLSRFPRLHARPKPEDTNPAAQRRVDETLSENENRRSRSWDK